MTSKNKTTSKVTYRIRLHYYDASIALRSYGDRYVAWGLTLREAQVKLLQMYNERFAPYRPFAKHWGIAVAQSRRRLWGAKPTEVGGLRWFDWDGRSYWICPD